VTGKPLSLRQLDLQWRSVGWVPFSTPQIHYPDFWVLPFEPSVDIVWLLAGTVFFAGSYGLIHFFGSLRAED
jgi:hypothetical protein